MTEMIEEEKYPKSDSYGISDFKNSKMTGSLEGYIMEYILRTNTVSKKYTKYYAVDKVSYSIKKGEI